MDASIDALSNALTRLYLEASHPDTKPESLLKLKHEVHDAVPTDDWRAPTNFAIAAVRDAYIPYNGTLASKQPVHPLKCAITHWDRERDGRRQNEVDTWLRDVFLQAIDIYPTQYAIAWQAKEVASSSLESNLRMLYEESASPQGLSEYRRETLTIGVRMAVVSRDQKVISNHAIAALVQSRLAWWRAIDPNIFYHSYTLFSKAKEWHEIKVGQRSVDSLAPLDAWLCTLYRQALEAINAHVPSASHAATIGKAQRASSQLLFSYLFRFNYLRIHGSPGIDKCCRNVALIREYGVAVRNALYRDGPAEEMQIQQLLGLLDPESSSYVMSWPLQSSPLRRGGVWDSDAPFTWIRQSNGELHNESFDVEEASRIRGGPVLTAKPYVEGIVRLFVQIPEGNGQHQLVDLEPLVRRLTKQSRRTALLLLDLLPKDLHGFNIGLVPASSNSGRDDELDRSAYFKAKYRIGMTNDELQKCEELNWSQAVACLCHVMCLNGRDRPLVQVQLPDGRTEQGFIDDHPVLFNMFYGDWELKLYDLEMFMHTNNALKFTSNGDSQAPIRFSLLNTHFGTSRLTQSELEQLSVLGSSYLKAIRWMTHYDSFIYDKLDTASRQIVLTRTLQAAFGAMQADSWMDESWIEERARVIKHCQDVLNGPFPYDLLEKAGFEVEPTWQRGRRVRQLFPRFSVRSILAYAERVKRRANYARFHLKLQALGAYSDRKLTSPQKEGILALLASDDSILSSWERSHVQDFFRTEDEKVSCRILREYLDSIAPTPLRLARHMYPTFSLSEEMMQAVYPERTARVGEHGFCSLNRLRKSDQVDGWDAKHYDLVLEGVERHRRFDVMEPQVHQLVEEVVGKVTV